MSLQIHMDPAWYCSGGNLLVAMVMWNTPDCRWIKLEMLWFLNNMNLGGDLWFTVQQLLGFRHTVTLCCGEDNSLWPLTLCVSEKGCSRLLSHNGPFTAFIPLLKTPLTVSLNDLKTLTQLSNQTQHYSPGLAGTSGLVHKVQRSRRRSRLDFWSVGQLVLTICQNSQCLHNPTAASSSRTSPLFLGAPLPL